MTFRFSTNQTWFAGWPTSPVSDNWRRWKQRTTVITSGDHHHHYTNLSNISYFRPPIDKYGTLQFDSFDEIREVGYYHGQTYFAGLRKAGQLWFLQQVQNRRRSLENLDLSSQTSASGAGAGATSYARFTDLAEMVCRVRQVTPVRPESYGHLDLETDPDESDIISDGDEELDEESGFISNACPEDVLQPVGLSQRNLSRQDHQHL